MGRRRPRGASYARGGAPSIGSSVGGQDLEQLGRERARELIPRRAGARHVGGDRAKEAVASKFGVANLSGKFDEDRFQGIGPAVQSAACVGQALFLERVK